MKFRISLFLLSLLIFTAIYGSLSIAKDINNILKYKNEQLNELERKKKELKALKEGLLKIYLALYVKKLYKNDISEFLKSSDYLFFLEEGEMFKFIEKALLRKLIKITEEEKELDMAYSKILKDIEKLKNEEKMRGLKALAVNPINGEPIKEGKHYLKVKEPISILAPIDGIVRRISYKASEVNVIIEGKKCTASLSGLDEIIVNVGDQIVKKQTIGKIKTPKNLSLFINCRPSKI